MSPIVWRGSYQGVEESAKLVDGHGDQRGVVGVGAALRGGGHHDEGPSTFHRHPATGTYSPRVAGVGLMHRPARRPPAEAEGQYYAHLQVRQHTDHT
jgi:hypothetical protein